MDKYNWLVKRQQKAMKVFENTKNELLSLCEQLAKEMKGCEDRILEHNESIAMEKDSREFLVKQAEQATRRAEKITEILGA